MKIKWDNVSKTFSIASELSVLNKRHFRKKTKVQKVQSLTLLPPYWGFFIFFPERRQRRRVLSAGRAWASPVL